MVYSRVNIIAESKSNVYSAKITLHLWKIHNLGLNQRPESAKILGVPLQNALHCRDKKKKAPDLGLLEEEL